LLELAPDAAALVPVVDPDAAAAAHNAGVGRRITLALGHNLDPHWGRPLSLTAEVVNLGNGAFRYSGGIWEGKTGHMGPCAVLRTRGVQVLVASHATYDWADEQFRAVGLDARQAKFVVVKNPMNYRLGYAGLYRDAVLLDTPGPTPAVLHHVAYQRLARPYYPADRDIPGLQPRVWRHER
jgi:microcystin degradation protein MlrC